MKTKLTADKHENYYEVLLQNSVVPTFVLNDKNNVVLWNKALEKFSGIKSSDILNTDEHWKVFYDFKRPCLADVIINGKIQELPDFCESSANVISKGLHGEGWFDSDSIGKKYLIMHAAPVYNDVGDLIAVIQTIQDFTERKLTEEMLYSEHNLRNLINKAPMAILLINNEGQILSCNPAGLKILGSPSEEVTRGINTLTYPPVVKSGLSESIRKCLETGEDLVAEHLYETIWEKKVYLRSHMTPLRGAKGEVIAVLELAEDFTERRLMEQALEEKNLKMHAELELASKVQAALLPCELPDMLGISFAWEFKPSIYVAGDMFNIFKLDETHIGFYILDVMGHGVSAALKAIAFSNQLDLSSLGLNAGILGGNTSVVSPAEILNSLNNRFFNTYLGETFVTVFYGILDTKKFELKYARAGHVMPIVVSENAEVYELKGGGPALGMKENIMYQDRTAVFNPGNKIILYTDGITEAKSPDNEIYSKKRFVDVLTQKCHLPIGSLIQESIGDVLKFVNNTDLNDDLTLMGVEILKTSPPVK